MISDYRLFPISVTLDDMIVISEWISSGSKFHQDELPQIREKFDRVIGLLQDIRGRISEDRVAPAVAAATQEG